MTGRVTNSAGAVHIVSDGPTNRTMRSRNGGLTPECG